MVWTAGFRSPSYVVKLLPWAAVVSGPMGAMPQDFESKIGTIASTVVNTLVSLGQMIYKGLVALGTFLVNLAVAIADWGMRILGDGEQAQTHRTVDTTWPPGQSPAFRSVRAHDIDGRFSAG